MDYSVGLATRYLLSRYGGRAVTRAELEELCARFELDYSEFVQFIVEKIG